LQISGTYFVKPVDALTLKYCLGLGLGVFSYALFDMEGHQVPQALVVEVGEVFECLLEEVTFLPVFVLGVNWFMVEPLRRLSHEHNS
jgi:hypothetical protein